MLGVLLRRQGWPVAYLGQNVPFADLAAFVEQVQPGAVVLVAMLRRTGAGAGRLADMDQADRRQAAGRFRRAGIRHPAGIKRAGARDISG